MLMNMKELLSVANEHNFAVPAFNIGSANRDGCTFTKRFDC